MKNLLWDAALKRLKEGNSRFVNNKLNNPGRDITLRQELTKGQHPYAIILSCADSRVVPEMAFDAGLGELFVIRVAGNIANPSTVASIEYAVANLDVNLIVVMGHQSCGAITAALAGGDAASSSLEHLLEFMQPAVDAAGSTEVNTVVKKNAELTAEQLAATSDIIKKEIEIGELHVLSAYYNIDSGRVDFLDHTVGA